MVSDPASPYGTVWLLMTTVFGRPADRPEQVRLGYDDFRPNHSIFRY
jgi:hypothetical protein